jgi:hypothetical protein
MLSALTNATGTASDVVIDALVSHGTRALALLDFLNLTQVIDKRNSK